MGKTALIIVTGLAVTLGYIQYSLRRTTRDAVENVTEYYEHATARNLANSAINYYLSQLYRQPTLRGMFVENDVYMDGGIDTVWITGSDTLGDTVEVRVAAYYGTKSHEIRAKLLITTFPIPPITTALGFSGANPTLDIVGDAKIDGNDYKMDGSPGSCPALPGVIVPTESDSSRIVNDLGSKAEQIDGLGGPPSIRVQSIPDPRTFVDALIANADFNLESGTYSTTDYGTQSNPVIVYAQGDVKFAENVTGYGILIVNGRLSLTGNFRWYGLVIVTGGEPEVLASGGANQIFGMLILGGSGVSAVMKGTADIKYSCEAIDNMVDNTQSLRTFRMLSWFE